MKNVLGRSYIEDAVRRFGILTQEETRMMTVQNLKATHGVKWGVTGLRNDVQGVSGSVEAANNKLDVILHGAELVLFDRYPFNWFSDSSFPIQAQINLLEKDYVKNLRTGSPPPIYLQFSIMQPTPVTNVPGNG
jgi:hypothetical protein